MAWEVIAEASSTEELQGLNPAITDIPNGSPILITITLPWWLPMASLANLAGVEWFAERFAGTINVIDVRGPDAYTIEIEGTANGLLWLILVPVLIVVLGALAVFGINSWSKVQVATQQTEQAKTQQATEQSRILFIEKYESTLGVQATLDLLNGVTKPTVQQQADSPSLMDDLKKAIVPAVSIGAVVLIGALIFFGMKYLPKPHGATV